jgi:uncharacterized repeat protein (TIGR01451 family)
MRSKVLGRRRMVAPAAMVALAAIAAGVIGAAAQAADPADLKVTKTDSADPVSRGGALDYTIVAENLGPDEATNVVVEDKLPGGLDYKSSSTTAAAGSCAKQGKTITCNLGNLLASAQETVTIRTIVTKRKGTIENTATVSSDTADPVSANNSDTEKTTVRVASGPSCLGSAATILGTSAADVITGTNHRDVILAGGGSDQVTALGGADLVCAGSGFDLVKGGAKGDRVKGGANADRLRGGAGNDALRGGRGRDRLRGGLGDDLLAGGPGRDRCRGGPGVDTLLSC